MQNRKSAKKCRLKKKAEFGQMRGDVKKLLEENKNLKEKVGTLPLSYYILILFFRLTRLPSCYIRKWKKTQISRGSTNSLSSSKLCSWRNWWIVKALVLPPLRFSIHLPIRLLWTTFSSIPRHSPHNRILLLPCLHCSVSYKVFKTNHRRLSLPHLPIINSSSYSLTSRFCQAFSEVLNLLW